MPDILLITIVDAKCSLGAALRRGNRATVEKYTEVTLVSKVSLHSLGSCPFQSSSFNSCASSVSGCESLGPETPAAATRRETYFSLAEIWETSDSRSDFLRTSLLNFRQHQDLDCDHIDRG